MSYPLHIGIIADGNRTRAKQQGLTAMDGHFAGAQRTLELLEYIFSTTPVKVVTGRFLSTENLLNRAQEEISFIFSTLIMLGNDLDEILEKHKINFRRKGNRNNMPENVLEFLDEKEKKFTLDDSDKTIVLAFNYGGRDEIIRGIKSIPPEKIATLTEDEFSKYLDFADLHPLDMVIRTKGDVAHRTSGFMSWRIGYAELYFAKDHYPAFSNEKLDEALAWFDSVSGERNYGK